MNDTDLGSPEVNAPWRFSIRDLLWVQTGAAGVVAVGVFVHQFEADWAGRTISGPKFVVCVAFWAVVGYSVARCFFTRFTGLIVGIALAGMAGIAFARPKWDPLSNLAILGMLVGCSLFIGFGWLDRDATPFSKRTARRSGDSNSTETSHEQNDQGANA